MQAACRPVNPSEFPPGTHVHIAQAEGIREAWAELMGKTGADLAHKAPSGKHPQCVNTLTVMSLGTTFLQLRAVCTCLYMSCVNTTGSGLHEGGLPRKAGLHFAQL